MTRSAAAVAALLCVWVSAGCNRQAPLAVKSSVPSRAEPPPVPVSVTRVQRRTLRDTVQIAGLVAADRRAAVSAEGVGRITSVAAMEGDAVSAGQVLVTLLDRDARARLSVAEAELRTARQRVSSAQADVEITRTDVRLSEARAIEEVRMAEARLRQARSDLEQTRQSIGDDADLARAQLAGVQARLRRLKAGARPQEVARAEADLDGARADVTGAEREVEFAEIEHRRKAGLAERGFLAAQEVDNARKVRDRARASLAAAEARVRTAEEALKLCRAGTRPEEIEEAQADVRAAEARVQAAERQQALLTRRREEVAAAEAEVARARRILDAERAGSGRVAKTRQDQQVMLSAVATAEANVRVAREELAKLVIRAPISGVVARRVARPGEMASPGQTLLEVIDPASLYLEGAVADADVARVRIGQQAEVRFRALRERAYACRVEEILPPNDAQGKPLRLKLSLGEALPKARVGMLAAGTLVADEHRGVLAIPAAALLSPPAEGDGGEVFVARDGAARRCRVRLGAIVGDLVEVTGGLVEGELLVVEGQAMLREGRRVSVEQTPVRPAASSGRES